MKTTTRWATTLAEQPELRNVTEWPADFIHDLPEDKRRRFLRNRKLVQAVVEQKQSVSQVAKQFNVTPQLVYHYLRRSLAPHGDTGPALAQGLIPHTRRGYTKDMQSIRARQKPAGPGLFQGLLDECVGLRDHLDTLIEQDLMKRRYRRNLTPSSFHAALIRYVREAGWPANAYPFNTEKQAQESSRLYFKKRLSYLRNSKAAKERTEQTRIIASGLLAPFEEVQFDEHLIDAETGLTVQLWNGFETTVRLARFWLLLLVCVSSRCVLGYSYGFGRKINQSDVLRALQTVNEPRERMALQSPGLNYAPDAGYPVNVSQQLLYATPSLVRMDNDWSHHGNAVRRMIRRNWNAAVNFGRPAFPVARGLVEAIFKRIEYYGHQLPSTTGSNPLDPRRHDGNRRQPPIVSCRSLEEIIDVVIADYNGTTQPELLARSPLQNIQETLERGLIVRKLTPELRQTSLFMQNTEIVHVNKPRDENIRPRINWLYSPYKGAAIDVRPDVWGAKVRITFHRLDIRTLQVFTLQGEHLGEVHVGGRWRQFPHSQEMRRRIHKLVKDEKLSRVDPLSAYLDRLGKSIDKPSVALELMRWARNADEVAEAAGMEPPNTAQTGTVKPRYNMAAGLDDDWFK